MHLGRPGAWEGKHREEMVDVLFYALDTKKMKRETFLLTTKPRWWHRLTREAHEWRWRPTEMLGPKSKSSWWWPPTGLISTRDLVNDTLSFVVT